MAGRPGAPWNYDRINGKLFPASVQIPKTTAFSPGQHHAWRYSAGGEHVLPTITAPLGGL